MKSNIKSNKKKSFWKAYGSYSVYCVYCFLSVYLLICLPVFGILCSSICVSFIFCVSVYPFCLYKKIIYRLSKNVPLYGRKVVGNFSNWAATIVYGQDKTYGLSISLVLSNDFLVIELSSFILIFSLFSFFPSRFLFPLFRSALSILLLFPPLPVHIPLTEETASRDLSVRKKGEK